MPLYQKPRSPYWWIDITPAGGKRVRESTGVRHDAPTADLRAQNKQLALIRLHERYTELMTARIHKLEPLPALTPITFSDYGKWYLEHVTAHHRGADAERYVIERWRTSFGQMPLTSITAQDIMERMSQRLRDVKPITVRQEFGFLRAMFNHAIPKYLTVSPMARVKMPKAVPLERRALTREEEGQLLPHLSPQDRALVIAAIDTGVRAGDLLNLTWADDCGTHFRIRDPKNRHPYAPPISTRLRAALDGLKHGAARTARIFPIKTTAQRRSKALPYMLASAAKRAGIPYGQKQGGITFHCLRHTGATRYLEAGGTLRELQAWGNWKNLRHLSTYTHPDAAKIRERVDRIGDGVTERVTRRRPNQSRKIPQRSAAPRTKRTIH